MRRAHRTFVVFSLCTLASGLAGAQSLPAAGRAITPSIFAGGSGVRTGLDSGRNFSVTAGVDLTFLARAKLQPALEYRGMYAIHGGVVDSLKSNLGGLKLSGSYGDLRPYVDALAGRGETTYGPGDYQVPGKLVFYRLSSSNVFSLGGGADVRATEHLAVKVDLQLQRYSSPVVVSGHLYSETGTIGLVYVFSVGHAAR